MKNRFYPTSLAISALTSLLCCIFLLVAPHAIAQTTWTGTNGTDWATPGNWSPAVVPLATDDVVIPNTTNKPTIGAGTAAVAKTVEVQSGATLTIATTASLTINGSKTINFTTAGFYNAGTVENNGQLILGNTASVGQIGLWNIATFNNNSGGDIKIDNATNTGLYNQFGTFTNAASITIGASSSVGSYGLNNSTSFNNNTGGNIKIDNATYTGLYHSSGTFTNAAQLTIGASSSVGTYGLNNNAPFNNNTGGNIKIDNATDTGLYHSSGTFTNAAQITIGSSSSAGQYGLQNRSTFNNTGGIIKIDNTTNTGLYNDSGTFNNAAQITIGASNSVGLYGLYNFTAFNNNAGGDIKIDNATNRGLYHRSDTFTNVASIIIGAVASVGTEGIGNQATFNNTGCSALIKVVSNAIINNTTGTFTNSGTIIENASGNSSINSNSGLVQNLNGGTFSINTNTGTLTTSSGVIWTGCTNTDWATASNWSLGAVPLATDDVIIPNTTNQPIIGAGTAAVAKSVLINASASLTINATGSLAINGSSVHGLDNYGTIDNSGTIRVGNTAAIGAIGIVQRNGGTLNNKTGGAIYIDQTGSSQAFYTSGIVNNDATIEIGSNATVTGQGLFIETGTGTFNNKANSLLTINRSTVHGLENYGTLDNSGTIRVGNLASVAATGIVHRSGGTFNNKTGGAIYIDRTGSGEAFYTSGVVSNEAIIEIGSNAAVIGNGISVEGGMFNNNAGGDIRIDRSTVRGILNHGGTFNNGALITIGASASVGQRGLENVGTTAIFNNNAGEIKIDNATSFGLYNEGGSTFTNVAKITIGATASIGGEGIYNYNTSTFNNNTGGDIKIDRTGRGFLNHTASFNNAALITIGASASVGQRGLNNFNGTFNNNAGEIKIDNATAIGLYNESGTFTNVAKITIGAVAAVGTNGLQNDDTFQNNACGQLFVLRGTLLNSATNTFTNAGLVKVSNTLTNNGIFTNNGIIEYPQSSALNNVTNNDVIVAPISTCGTTATPAIQLGGSNSFTVGSTWYSDAALSTPAGTYNQASNTFTLATLQSLGTQTLYFTINDSSNPCPRTVAIQVTVNAGGPIIYVTPAGAGLQNGSSWANALSGSQLQYAINTAASCGAQVWVAKGTYYPTVDETGNTSPADPRNKTFVMKSGVPIYGGFAGSEAANYDLSLRSFTTNETILSGDIDQNNTLDNGNAYNVLVNLNTDNTAILDGFTVSGGYYGLPDPGFPSRKTRGSAIFNYLSSPTIRNCIFSNNVGYFGNAYNVTSSATFTNCVFVQNQNTLFWNEGGGAISLINNTITANGGNIIVTGSSTTTLVKNSIIWGNGGGIGGAGSNTITNSIVQGGFTGTGNLNQDPLFVNQPTYGSGSIGDLRLLACSPAIDKGDDADNTTTTDVTGNPRKFESIAGGSQIDLGAYERQQLTYSGTILYVNQAVSSSGDGTSWGTAFKTLQEALQLSCPNVTQIWVAKGTYYPTADETRNFSPSDARNKTFLMKNNIAIYGGFAGNEAANYDLSLRNFTTNETILSGDIDQNNTLDNGNAYNVLVNISTDNTAILDGFTVSGGYYGLPDPGFPLRKARGSAMYSYLSSPTIRNCIFSNNVGFYGNTYNLTSSATFTNCVFVQNDNNAAFNEGGGTTSYINCTFVANARAINNNSGSTIVKNSIIWGNTNGIAGSGVTVTNSIVQGGFTGTGNLNQDPLFVNQPTLGSGTTGDLRLQACSIAIDKGDDADNTTTTDVTGNPRKFESIAGGSQIDLGAYERQQLTYSGTILYVNQAVSSSGDGTSWSTAFKTLQEALQVSCPNVTQIWVAKGTYYPTADASGNTSPTDARTKTFVMKNDVAIYGGFAGGEAANYDLSLRNFTTNETILSGDIDGTPDVVTGSGSTLSITGNGGNVYHVFSNASGLTNTAILDGFTVSGGNANGTDPHHRGGGMWNNGSGSGNFCSPTIRNCNFTHNNASSAGGAIHNQGTNGNSSPQISNCVFTANLSSAYGGGISQFGNGTTNLTYCDFNNNKAGFGGAIAYSTGAGNTATHTFLNCNFTGNAAGFGGAIQSGFSFETGTRTVSMTNCTFTDNRAQGGGAFGNGLQYTAGSTPVFFTNCIFKNNLAHDGSTIGTGGAYQSEGGLSSQAATFTNCLLDGNKAMGTADDGGGAILIYDGTVTLINSTVVNSQTATHGGAISIYGNTGSATIKNSILWNNTAASNNNIYNGNSGSANAQYSLLQDTSCPANVTCGTGMLYNQNPLFVSSSNFSLQGCSPAINVGNDADNSTITDIAGSARKFGVIDMGAYERQQGAYNGTILYVNQAVSSSGDGTSWATAFKTLQEALLSSCSGITQIWVAKGTYYPDEGGSFANNDRNASFTMKNGVAIYGGFDGTEASNYNLTLRNFVTNQTTLSGEIQQDNDPSNNSLNVILNAYLEASRLYNTAILDGFTVTGGNANGTKNVPIPTGSVNIGQFGGGISNVYASPTIANCIFTGNSALYNGGGFSSWYSYDDMRIVNCSFTNNSATQFGGGLYLFQTRASNGILVLKKIVVANNVSSQVGGGIMIADSQIGFENSVITNNSGSTGGGGYSYGSSVSLFNCTFYGNTATSSHAGGFHFGTDLPTRLTITNSIFWSNKIAGNTISSVAWSGIEGNAGGYTTYSDLERTSGVYTGTGNINQDPLFVNTADPDGADNIFGTADDGLRLQACSPAINTGIDTGSPTTDLLGNARVGTTDMGAYEYQGNAFTQPTASASTTTSVICVGNTINLSSSGGSNFSWAGPNGSNFSSNEQNPNFTGSATTYTGVYTVSVANANCPITATATVSVQVNALPTISVTIPPAQCGGTINLNTVFNSNGSLTFFTDSGFSSAVTNPVSSGGPYYAKAIDATTNCSVTASVSVTINTSATISVTTPPAQCGGTINLSTAFSSNGTLSYFTDSGFTSTSANPVAASGPYYAKASVGTCTNSASVSITINPLPTISVTIPPAQCGGTINLNTVFSSNRPMLFFTDSGFTSTIASPVSSGGPYYAKAIDATTSCSVTASVSITINTSATISVTTPSAQCGGTINLSTAFSSNGTLSYFTDSGFTSTSANPVAASGPYYAKASVGTCTNSASVSITINPLPTLNISPSTSQVCASQSLSLSATAGLTGYAWSKSGGTFGSSNNLPTISFSSSTPGNFTLTVTASNGSCSASASALVLVNGQVIPLVSSNAPLCTGTTLNLSVDISGASYTWRGPGFTSTEQNPSRGSFSTGMIGVYSITVSNSLGCSGTGTVNVQAKPSPTPQVSSNSPLCAGNTLQLSASGGSSYSWRASDGFASTEQNPARPTVSASMSGGYSLTVTNSNGCTASNTLSVSVQAAALSASPNPLGVCLGQTINLSANASPAASAFFWKGPGNFSSTTQNISTYATTTANLGIYSVSATIGSCVVTSTAEVKSGAVLQAGVVGLPCVGGTIQFTASGMTSYTWSRPTNNFNSTLQNPVIPSSTMNDAGVYFLSARSGSCFVSMLVPVMIAGTGISPSFSVTPSSFAAGATVSLSAASATGSYSWSGPNGFSGNTRTKTISNFQVANNGVYRLTLTVGTCTGYTEQTISVNTATRLAAAEPSEEAIGLEINAYPNPVTHTLTVEVRLKKPSALQLNLVNSVGKPSGTWQLNEVSTFHKTELNLSDLQGGVYLLQAQAGKQKVVKRVVKIQY